MIVLGMGVGAQLGIFVEGWHVALVVGDIVG
jgi:hypothetical protein